MWNHIANGPCRISSKCKRTVVCTQIAVKMEVTGITCTNTWSRIKSCLNHYTNGCVRSYESA